MPQVLQSTQPRYRRDDSLSKSILLIMLLIMRHFVQTISKMFLIKRAVFAMSGADQTLVNDSSGRPVTGHLDLSALVIDP